MKAHGVMKLNGRALGIIETVGLVPAIEAGDVAVKTADVSILGSQAVGGGLVSILMTGDVSAVKASVDAGSTAAARLGEVLSITVIARTAEGLDGILIEEAKRPTCVPERKAPEAEEPEILLEPEVEPEPEPAALPDAATPDLTDSPSPADEGGAEDALTVDMADLKKLKVTKLRRLARQIPTFSIPRGEIKYAKKKDLLEAFVQYMKTLEK
ncbi:BMC domain-containing protein [Desulfoluna butyratoxydans]|uniref:Microcompartment protein bacteria n=1 Tax=Desulfoluna butyratoxydans TaxID=231438 RepID=A0A4U8YMP9_9BACT|nr:BMC domain-containing protein [Desulfoluna butyratoxydans]VFQ45050.1 microcompartment protein bacteria [Desulfoluna butyratoxydans]